MEPISLDTPQPQDTAVSLGVTPTVNDAATQSRAAKAAVGLGSITGQDLDSIYSQFSAGQEDNFRASAAATMDYKAAQDIKDKPAEDIVNYHLTKEPTDQKSVIEKAYATTYVNSLKDAASRIDDNVLTTAQTEDPDAVNRFFSQGSDILSRREYAITAAQNIQSKVDNDAYFHVPFPQALGGPIAIGSKTSPWHSAFSWASSLILPGVYGSLRDEYLSRGNTPDTPKFFSRDFFTGTDLNLVFEGNNTREQALELLRQPTFKQYQELFDKGFNGLAEEDPAKAQQWAASIAGMSTDEMITRDAMSGANLLMAGGLFKVAKNLIGGVGRAALGRTVPASPLPEGPTLGGNTVSGDLSRGADGVYRVRTPDQEATIQTAQKAVEDVLKNSPASPTKANVAEAVGDTKEAAVQKTMVSIIDNNPNKDAVDTLFELHRSNQAAIRSAPGNTSREEHTRMLDAGESFEKGVTDALVNTTGIVRLPALAETGFRDVAYRVSVYFKGVENSVVNIDMVHDSVSNTEQHVVTIANRDGRPFTDIQQAQNFAVNRGMGRIKVVGNDPDTIYLPKVAVLSPSYQDSFKTSKGSVYTLHEDGTTTRVKAPRPEHPGDSGLKDRSLATGYVTEGEFKAYQAAVKAKTNAAHIENGRVHLFTDVNNFVHIKASDKPAKGLMPIEMLPNNRTHFGNPITEFGAGNTVWKPNPSFVYKKTLQGWQFYIGHPDGTEMSIQPTTAPEPTHIPFNLQTGKFGNPNQDLAGPVIHPNGLGYHIKWTIPLNETDDLIRDKYLMTDRTRSASSAPRPFVNGLLGYFRLPQDTLSLAENENRAKVVSTQTRYTKLIDRDMVYVNKILNDLTPGRGVVREDFKRALTASQKLPDPDTGLPGYYMKTPLELEHFWQSNFGRAPTVGEKEAYLAVGRLDYADWVFRNVAVYKNKSRLGVMEHTLQTDPPSPPFEGRLMRKLPEGDIPAMIHERDGTVKWYNAMNTKQKKVYRDAFNKGEYRAVQLYSPDKYPVKVFDANKNPVRIVYVISNAMESSPMTYKQVGYRGGGHWDYNYDYYIKQPIMRTFKQGGKSHWVYEGDATFAPIKNNADGQVFIKNLNQIIKLLKARKIGEAKTVHKAYSDQDWKDFIKGFYPTKDAKTGEMMPARFNLHEEFRVLPKGYTTAEYDRNFVNKYKALPNSKFVNSANGEQSLDRNFQVEYTGQRDSHDLFEPRNTGTVLNPLYKFQPAELVDPLVAQTRALRRIINSAAGDDYKYTAVEHWLQENIDMLDVHSKAEARHSPFATFLNNNLTRRWANSLRGQVALSNRYKIRKLIGMPTYLDSSIQMAKQAISDMAFETDSPAKKALLVPASWTLGKIHSPVSFFRGMAFHENIGLFNWMQIAAQNAAYINFAAMSPGHAIQGTFGALMHQWSRINKNPAIIDAMDKKASLFGWKPGQFKEAMRIYDTTGFDKIGNSLVIHDPDVKFLMSTADRVLATGSKYFFELAEANVRHGAWYTAYHEYRNAFPNRKIDDLETGKILRRANDLYMNMGRDSKTFLTTGVGSMTLQFFKYQENVTHTFLSKRIGDSFEPETLVKGEDGTYRPKNTNTWQKRARVRAQMIAMYSLMYGTLGAGGLALLPTDWARKTALEHGYVPGQHWYSSLVMEGGASMAGAWLSGWWRTGNTDLSKGTFYNFNNRYGINNQIIRDLLEGNKTFWGILLGASGSTLANNLSSLSPFVYAWKSAWNDEQDNPFKLTLSDWEQGLRNVSSFRAADRLYYAIALGKWLDSHGRPQQDVGKIDAIFRTLLGTNDVNLDDLYLLRESKADRIESYKKGQQEYEHYLNLQREAIKNNDTQQATQYGRDANFALKSRDIPADEAAKIFAQERNSSRNIQDKVYDDYYKSLVPVTQQPTLDEAYRARRQQ